MLFNHSSGEAEAGGLPVWASLGYIMRLCTQTGDSDLAGGGGHGWWWWCRASLDLT